MVAFATQVKRRRGTAEQNNEFTGAEGEIVVNLTDKSLRVHDGQTKGGFETLRQNMQNSVNITNCITEIPQDIKLELNNGTLTLKAGSKVYVPNGTGNYELYTVAQDIQATGFPGNLSRFVYVNVNNNSMDASINAFSGNTAPTVSGTGFWYDTENNVVKRASNSGTTWTTGFSFPIAIVTSVNDVATSIDQVFNGFGYIGSTAFALPGVKALAPNGRNADGTLKNRAITINAVSTTTDISGATGGLWYTIDNNNITRVNFGTFTFNEELNYFVNSSGQRFGFVIIDENAYRTSGKVTSFNPKKVFRAVDYSDFENIVDELIRTHTSNVVRLVAEQKATPENNYTWYRKYADGWVEQGGVITSATADSDIVVSLPVAMVNDEYYLHPAIISNSIQENPPYYVVGARQQTSVDFTVYARPNMKRCWIACGYAAE